jgi:hypothetical protein
MAEQLGREIDGSLRHIRSYRIYRDGKYPFRFSAATPPRMALVLNTLLLRIFVISAYLKRQHFELCTAHVHIYGFRKHRVTHTRDDVLGSSA